MPVGVLTETPHKCGCQTFDIDAYFWFSTGAKTAESSQAVTLVKQMDTAPMASVL